MKLKDLKEKLKNKVQESKTKQFVEEHKRGIKLGLMLIPISALGIYGIKLNYEHAKLSYENAKLSNHLAGYREGFRDGIMTLSIGIDEALKNNNVTPELGDKLAKDSAKVVKPIVQKVLKD